MVTKEQRVALAAKFGSDAKDTGSAAVQIAFLTARIDDLKPHFAKHGHDYHANRGLMKMIGQRRRLLKHLAENDKQKYAFVLKELGLRK